MKRKDEVPMVDTEVRRSYRLQKNSKGFKKEVCRDKDCLDCHVVPPTIPTKIIKSLNTSFCKVAVKDTTEEKFGKKAKRNKGSSTALEGNKTSKEQSKKWI